MNACLQVKLETDKIAILGEMKITAIFTEISYKVNKIIKGCTTINNV